MSESNHVSPETCECRKQAAPAESALPLSYARTLSWLSLVVILLTSLGLSFFISNSARETLLTRQEDFARLLVENLNSQIFRRFALPTILASGRIALRQPTQYEHLDRVVQSVIQGLPVERLRIYDFSRLVAYSTKKEDVGRAGLSPPNLDDVLHGAAPKSEIISSIPAWQAPFRVPLREGTFVLRVLYPLRGEPLRPGEDAPVMGALELTQDITGDYEQVLAFQGCCSCSSTAPSGCWPSACTGTVCWKTSCTAMKSSRAWGGSSPASRTRSAIPWASSVPAPNCFSAARTRPIRARRAFWEPFMTNPYAFPRRSMIFWTTPGRASPARIWWM